MIGVGAIKAFCAEILRWVGTNADVASATGSAHAKLKDIRAAQLAIPKTWNYARVTLGTSYADLLNVSGAGVLNSIKVLVTYLQSDWPIDIRFTVDGGASYTRTITVENTNSFKIWRVAGEITPTDACSMVAELDVNIQFATSLRVEVRRTGGVSFTVLAQYALV